jgi:hypothetical protein
MYRSLLPYVHPGGIRTQDLLLEDTMTATYLYVSRRQGLNLFFW